MSRTDPTARRGVGTAMAAALVFIFMLAGEAASLVGMTSGLFGASFVVEVDWMAAGCALFVLAGVAALVDRRRPPAQAPRSSRRA